MKKIFIILALAVGNFANAVGISDLSDEELTRIQNVSSLACNGKRLEVIPVTAVGESLPGVKLVMDLSSGAIFKEGNDGLIIVGRVASGIAGGLVSTVVSEVALALSSGASHAVGFVKDIFSEATGTGWGGYDGPHQAGNELGSATLDAPGAIYNNTAELNGDINKTPACKVLKATQREVGLRAQMISNDPTRLSIITDLRIK